MKTNLTKAHSKGFTLIEMLVALAILSLIALLAVTAFDGSRSKAEVMVALAKQVADANIALKNDTGCYVSVPQALFDTTAAQNPADNYCGMTFGDNWARPYLAVYPVDANGDIKADKIASGVTVSLTQQTSGTGTIYAVKFNNVPLDIVKQGLISCNGNDTAQGTFPTQRCSTTASLGSSSTGLGDFSMMYDQTQ
jgi:prepilin-type N-terminal cleavage/methylation domain-containing protein